MKQLLTKPFADIDKSDIDRLIANAEDESSVLELKGLLPGGDPAEEPWQSGKDRIWNSTRDEVLSEVVGMANAGGGVVILGIDETGSDPARAKAPSPLRDCVSLAGRFENMAWSIIDPRLASLEVKGVPLSEDGGGVVIFRVLTSPRSPHGLTTTCRAYIRRGTHTEKMYVKEIQEMTLQSQRGSDWIWDRLAHRGKEFWNWWHAVKFYPAGGAQSDVRGGIRASVIPASQVVAIDEPYANADLWPDPKVRKGSIHGLHASFNLLEPMFGVGESASHPPKPILRGGRRDFIVDRGVFLRQEIFWDGLCDIWRHKIYTNSEKHFDPIDVLCTAAEALKLADRARRAGGAPGIELILQVELARTIHGRCAI